MQCVKHWSKLWRNPGLIFLRVNRREKKNEHVLKFHKLTRFYFRNSANFKKLLDSTVVLEMCCAKERTTTSSDICRFLTAKSRSHTCTNTQILSFLWRSGVILNLLSQLFEFRNFHDVNTKTIHSGLWISFGNVFHLERVPVRSGVYIN